MAAAASGAARMIWSQRFLASVLLVVWAASLSNVQYVLAATPETATSSYNTGERTDLAGTVGAIWHRPVAWQLLATASNLGLITPTGT